MTVSGLTMIKTSRHFFQSCERRPEESIPPTQLRPVNFPVEYGQLLTQREILGRERCSGQDQAPDEPKKLTISRYDSIAIRSATRSSRIISASDSPSLYSL
jgi:hypothetical protein